MRQTAPIILAFIVFFYSLKVAYLASRVVCKRFYNTTYVSRSRIEYH